MLLTVLLDDFSPVTKPLNSAIILFNFSTQLNIRLKAF